MNNDEIKNLFTKFEPKSGEKIRDLEHKDKLLVLASVYLTQIERAKSNPEAIKELENLGKTILLNYDIEAIKEVVSEFGVLK